MKTLCLIFNAINYMHLAKLRHINLQEFAMFLCRKSPNKIN